MSRPDDDSPGALELAPLLEESAEDLYENAPCGYLSTATDGTIVRINATLLGWTGYEREDVVDRLRIQDLLGPGDRIFYETHYAPLLQMQGTVREIAVEISRADGSRMPALINSVLRRASADGAAVIRTTVFDARDRRRYERELMRARREAEDRARAAAALAHVNDGVLVVDGDGRIAVLNRAAESILALGVDAVGRRVGDAVPGWDAIGPRIPVGTLDAPPTPLTLPLHTEHLERWLSIAGVDAGEGVVYTIRDVTADHRLEKMRNELIGIVSHELRTPLAAAYGAAQTLLARELPDEQRRELLAAVVGQTERLTRIVDEILLSGRLETGELAVAVTAFDAAELAASVAEEVAAALDAGSRLQVDDGPAVLVAGDPAYVRQALANLVENACKYSPPESPVVVRVVRGERRARLIVDDEGPGVPASQRERIFERFHRLDPDLRHGVGGVGLGLYIARALVERMEGRLGLEPKEAGSRFFIELPLAEPS